MTVKLKPQERTIRPSVYTRAAGNPTATLTVAGVAAASVGAFLWSRRSRQRPALPEPKVEGEEQVEAHPS